MPRTADRRAAHIFRASEGHLEDTAENRKALIGLTSDPENFAGYDSYGHAWYARDLDDGTQLWAVVRDNEILNGGRNRVPRSFNSSSGLSRPEKKR